MNPPQNPNETVTVPKSEFMSIVENMNKMQSEIASLKANNNSGKPVKVAGGQTVTISYVNGKPVVGYGNHGSSDKPQYIYEAPNPMRPNEYLLYVDVIIQGVEKPIKLLYNEFMEQAEHHVCTVVSVRKMPWVVTGDEVTKKVVGESEYATTDTGIIVPMEVKGETRFFKVKLPDGSELELHERYVNINR